MVYLGKFALTDKGTWPISIMYERYFHLAHDPFSIAPNPFYLYLSDQHREALVQLQFVLDEGCGIAMLSGEVGTGKTTLWRCFVEWLSEATEVSVVLHPATSSRDLLRAICDDFALSYPACATLRELTTILNTYLLELWRSGKKALLILEECQNYSPTLLEHIRLLTNLETGQAKLLQVFLIGQPELARMLESDSMRQLRQRIVSHFSLQPLRGEEVGEYICHRLRVAGCQHSLFTPGAISHIAVASRGIPRLINLICARSMLCAYAKDEGMVGRESARIACEEVGAEKQVVSRKSSVGMRWVAAGFVAVGLIGVGGVWNLNSLGPTLENIRIAMKDKVSEWRQTLALQTPITVAVSRGHEVADGNDDQRSERPSGMAMDADVLGVPEDPSLTNMQARGRQSTTGTSGHNVRLFGGEDGRNTTSRRKPLSEQSHAGWMHTPFRKLLFLWGITPDISIGAWGCEYIFTLGMDCWHRYSDLAGLKQLNRPAMVKLLGADNVPYYRVLRAVFEETFFILGDEGEVMLTEGEFKDLWTGDYTILWKRPRTWKDTLVLGDSGPLIKQLKTKIYVLTKPYSDGGIEYSFASANIYDGQLEQAVRVLQSHCGLTVDGLLGKKTLMAITSLTDYPPKLIYERAC